MNTDQDHDASPSSDLTLAVIVAAVVCCAVPLLVAAGILGSAGIFLDNPIIAALGVAALAFATLKVIRTLHARSHTDDPKTRPTTDAPHSGTQHDGP